MTLSVPTLKDNIVEENEQFKATVSLTFGPGNAIIGSPHIAFVTITDATRMCLICVVNAQIANIYVFINICAMTIVSF